MRDTVFLVGNDSERLVLDYLSRVGDLAHSTTMTAAERAKLVGSVRSNIEAARINAEGVETAASVRKILKRMGKPEEVVAGAASGEAPVVPEPRPAPDRDSRGSERAEEERDSAPDVHGTGFPTVGAPPPHLAGMDELTEAESDPDWWRNDPSPYAKGSGGEMDGFIGGIEVPEMLEPPSEGDDQGGKAPGGPGKAAVPGQVGPPATEAANLTKDQEAKPAPPEQPAKGRGGVLLRFRPGGGARGPRVGGLVELTAALVLIVGASLGNLFVLAAGWLLAWWSPRLSRLHAKVATAGMPALVISAALVWVWGRTEERWGEPIPEGAMGDVLNESYPWVLRCAAGASALYLIWRARRPR